MVINTATACTQDCNQGRACTCCVQCMPAEACSEIGSDYPEPPREPMTAADAVICVLAVLSSVLLVVSAGHFIARLLS